MPRDDNSIERMTLRGKAGLLIAIVLASAVILAALAEGTVRLRSYLLHGSLGRGIETLYEVDDASEMRIPIAGFRSRRITIDSKGFRNPEFVTPKPAGTVRIAFLGGSTTFCAEVSSNDVTWPNLVVKALRSAYPDLTIDYINAGVPGYYTGTSRKNLDLRVAKYDPDVIVIYHATNDLTHFSRIAAKNAGIPFAFEAERLSWLAQYSQLVYLLEKNYFVWKSQRVAQNSKKKLDVAGAVLAEPFRKSLEDLVTRAQQIAKKVVLITFSTRIRADQSDEEQKKSAVTSLYYMPYITVKGFLRYFAAYNKAIREVASRTGAILIENEHSIPGTAEFYADSVHFTDRGSRLMAKRVAKGLTAAGVMESFVKQ